MPGGRWSRTIWSRAASRVSFVGDGQRTVPDEAGDDSFADLAVERKTVVFEFRTDQLGGRLGHRGQARPLGAPLGARVGFGVDLVERELLAPLHVEREFGPTRRAGRGLGPCAIGPLGTEMAVGADRLVGVAGVDGLGEEVDRLSGRDRLGIEPVARAQTRAGSARQSPDSSRWTAARSQHRCGRMPSAIIAAAVVLGPPDPPDAPHLDSGQIRGGHDRCPVVAQWRQLREIPVRSPGPRGRPARGRDVRRCRSSGRGLSPSRVRGGGRRRCRRRGRPRGSPSRRPRPRGRRGRRTSSQSASR